MTDRRALVTGVSGFIGSHLVKQLLADGWQVHAIVRPNSDTSSLKAVLDHVFLHFYDGTTESMQKALVAARPAVVFHLASLFLTEHQSKDVESLIQSNLLFGTQLAEVMTRHSVRWLVNTGTSWQHYENHEYSPVNLYAATKQAFEALLQYYVEANGLGVITLKLLDTYGPEDSRPKLMNLLKRVAVENQPLPMSPGEQRIDLVYVDDVVQAFTAAAERLLAGEVTGHERYAVSSGQPIQLREVVRQVERVLGRELPITWGGRPYRHREVMLPWSDAMLPGWVPQVELEQGLRVVFKETANLSISDHT